MKLIQYNKIALQQYQKALNIRLAALPVIRSKEGALRNEVKVQQQRWRALEEAWQAQLTEAAAFGSLWQHWQRDLLRLKQVQTETHTFAGVQLQRFVAIDWEACRLQVGLHPAWQFEAWLQLRALLSLRVQRDLQAAAVQALEDERKRTTQKLNLFEKVQIPYYEEAIRKIKRFLEDEETLIKATQKLVKKKKEKEAAA